jgi:hypothetical protein
MYRIDNPDAVTIFPTPFQPGNPGYFTAGNPVLGEPATIVDADWCNAIQEEISYVIEYSGLTLSKVDRTQLAQAIFRLTRLRLTANTTFYLAPPPLGNDNNNGLSSATPWATIRHAYDYIQNRVDKNGYNVTCQLADGTYTSASFVGGTNGIYLLGNTNSPQNVIVNGAGTDQGAIAIYDGAFATLEGLTLRNTNPLGGTGCGLFCQMAARAFINNVNFDVCSVAHINCSQASVVNMEAPYKITNNAPAHAVCTMGSYVAFDGSSVIISAGVAFSNVFLECTTGSAITSNGQTFNGTTFVGKRFDVRMSSVINTSTSNLNFYPGTIAGTADNTTGGFYG